MYSHNCYSKTLLTKHQKPCKLSSQTIYNYKNVNLCCYWLIKVEGRAICTPPPKNASQFFFFFLCISTSTRKKYGGQNISKSCFASPFNIYHYSWVLTLQACSQGGSGEWGDPPPLWEPKEKRSTISSSCMHNFIVDIFFTNESMFTVLKICLLYLHKWTISHDYL